MTGSIVEVDGGRQPGRQGDLVRSAGGRDAAGVIVDAPEHLTEYIQNWTPRLARRLAG